MLVQLLLLQMLVLRLKLLLMVLLLLLLLLLMRLLLMLLKLVLTYIPIHFRVLSRGIDWRYNGGIQFPLLLIFQLPHQLIMLPCRSLILVVLVVVGVRRRWRVGHIALGRVQGVGCAPSSPTSSTSSVRGGHCCCCC